MRIRWPTVLHWLLFETIKLAAVVASHPDNKVRHNRTFRVWSCCLSVFTALRPATGRNAVITASRPVYDTLSQSAVSIVDISSRDVQERAIRQSWSVLHLFSPTSVQSYICSVLPLLSSTSTQSYTSIQFYIYSVLHLFSPTSVQFYIY